MKDTLYMACKEYRLAWMKLFRAIGVYKFYRHPLTIALYPYVFIAYAIFIIYTLIFKS